MSYNGSGTFQINTSGQPVVAGTVISSTAFNALTADLATGLSTAITKDGQTTTTARIPFAQGINSSLTTDSTSTSTGSIITAGGVGIAKALYVGTTANIAGTTNLAGLTASSAVATDASKNLVSVTNTGTGNNVLATSPTLVTPALGTPSAIVLTNATSVPAAQITGSQAIPKSTLPTGSVLQVVSTTKTDGFSIAGSNTFTDITGLTVSITPNFSTSKILIIVNVGAASMNGGGSSGYRLARGGTGIGVGTTAGSRQGASWRDFNGTADPNASYGGRGFSFLDSPATTSATTYSLQLISENVTGYINISQNDLNTNDPRGTRAASTITVMEISA